MRPKRRSGGRHNPLRNIKGHGPSIHISLVTQDQELAHRIREHQQTMRLLESRARRRRYGRLVAWAIFWAIILAVVVLCTQALSEVLTTVINALESIGGS